ncbi:MAG TPA: hypothetical protein VKA86_08340 [Candidatus Krumholzibacteria bacterium]|nr:hypothetical protein [Candidatus Krumholzibacteria bacterium]
MTKRREHDEDHEDQERDAQGRRRVRLRPRSGGEHRFGFARRWEARRRSRSTRSIWALVGLDIGALLLIYLIAREVLERLGID